LGKIEDMRRMDAEIRIMNVKVTAMQNKIKELHNRRNSKYLVKGTKVAPNVYRGLRDLG